MTNRLILAIAIGTAVGFAQVPAENSAIPSGSADSGPVSTKPWEILNKGLQDSDPDHRKKAITAIGTIGAVPQAVQMVEQALHDKSTLVRQTAAAALGDMGSPDAIPALRAALDDGPEVSFTAAKSLWNLGDYTSSREIIWQVIKGERKDTPGLIKGGLRDAKQRLSPGQLALMGVKEAAGMLGPASMGIDAIQEALKATKNDGGSPGRVVAVGILAKDSDPYALTLLEWAIGDNSSAVRVAVAKALGDRGNQDTIPRLAPLLIDDAHAVRYMGAASIIKLKLKSATASR